MTRRNKKGRRFLGDVAVAAFEFLLEVLGLIFRPISWLFRVFE